MPVTIRILVSSTNSAIPCVSDDYLLYQEKNNVLSWFAIFGIVIADRDTKRQIESSDAFSVLKWPTLNQSFRSL